MLDEALAQASSLSPRENKKKIIQDDHRSYGTRGIRGLVVHENSGLRYEPRTLGSTIKMRGSCLTEMTSNKFIKFLKLTMNFQHCIEVNSEMELSWSFILILRSAVQRLCAKRWFIYIYILDTEPLNFAHNFNQSPAWNDLQIPTPIFIGNQ